MIERTPIVDRQLLKIKILAVTNYGIKLYYKLQWNQIKRSELKVVW